ncbi:MAG: ABC transporter ATP-binding protein [Planctomycetia bacterium]|jgi:oligopeptide transport system ATP-binding protein|nr:ABC transporter ATP-binding protein [Planctomycetia bacterium]
MATTTDTVLEVCDLRTHFHTDDGLVKAVDGVSFSVRRGETLGLVGESGSGKSVACLSALRLVPTPPAAHPSGVIRFAGKDLLTLPERDLERLRGNRLAMIFQDPLTALNPYLSVGRQLTEVLEVHEGATPAAARRAAIEMLTRVGIPAAGQRIDQYPHQFSGGMRQRVMIAMALLCGPEVLFADEPTTALDVTIQAQILDLIGELQASLGTAVVLVTHDLGVVAGTADRVAVMYAGRIVEEGTTAEVFANPLHPYTQGLLASMPRIDTPSRQRLAAIPGLPPDLGQLPSGCPFHPRCQQAGDRCRQAYPEVVIASPTHRAACWETEAVS